MYEIEKGFEVPVLTKQGTNRKYPWEEMQIGDSFLSKYVRMYSIANAASKRYGKKFACRKVDGGYRVWRTE